VNDFIEGEAKHLQEDLIRLDKESPTSWLEGFWDTMYLTIRDPLPVNVNPYFILNDDPLRTNQVDRAAGVIHASAKFYSQIVNETLTPDLERTTPLSMYQYTRLFGSYRVPLASGRDDCITAKGSRHIAVTINDRIFTLDIFRRDGTPVPEGDLRVALEEILKKSRDGCPKCGAPVSIFTSQNRDVWAVNRGMLLNDSLNHQSLNAVDSALFVVVLDPHAPRTLEQANHIMFTGDMRNRWFDKFQIIVTNNGIAGINMEHTPVDGHTALRLMVEIPSLLSAETKKEASEFKPEVHQLQWHVNGDIRRAIGVAEKDAANLIASVDSRMLEFKEFGADFIKSQKISPDAFVQMAYQLAYHKMKGKAASTYESANTKRFLHGRTETLRSVTRESVEFTKAFANKAATNQEKLDKLKKAADAHVKRMNEAKEGLGVDRHWFGLKNLAYHKQQRLPNYKVPAIFTDKSYATLSSSVISTSNCGSDALRSFGFGPVVSDGLGLGYMIHSNAIPITVSSFQQEASTYAQHLHNSLLEMKDVCANKQH